MTIRDLLMLAARPSPDAPDRKTSGKEEAGQGRNAIASIFGDTAGRVGTYDPSNISQSTYDKMEQHHQIAAGTELRVMPLLAADWSVEGPDARIASYVEAALAPHMAGIVRSCGWTGLGRGCAPHEVVWVHRTTTVVDDASEVDEDIEGWTLGRVKDIAPDAISSILVDGVDRFAGYRLTIPAGTDLPADKCFHFAHRMRFANHWGEGELRRAYEPWYRSCVIWDQWVRWLERRATPPTVVRHPVGVDESGTPYRDSAATIGRSLTTDDSYVTLPALDPTQAQWSVDFLKDGQTGTPFREAYEAHERMMLRAMLVGDKLFTEGTGAGAYSQSQTHFDIFMLASDSALSEILTAVNDQLVPRIVRWTFGPDVPPPRLLSVGVTDRKRDMLFELFKLAMSAGIAPLDLQAAADQLGLPAQAVESGVAQTEASARDELVKLAEAAQDARLRLAAHV